MKNNKACRGLLLVGMIFNFSFIIAYFMTRSIFISAGLNGIIGALSGLALLLGASLGILCVAIQGFLYYSRLEKNIFILGNSIASSVIAICIILVLFGAVGGAFITVSLVIAILLFVANLLAILSFEEKIALNALKPYLPKLSIDENNTVITEENTESQTPNPITINTKSIVEFFKSKVGKGILVAIVVCLVAVGGYKVWDILFNKIAIDVFENMELSFTGYDGEGKAMIDSVNPDYDKSNIDIKLFISDVDYEIVDNEKLSNDKKVTVKASYSQETARSLKLDVKSETKEFEVSGLIVRYDSAKDIDKDLYKEAKKYIDEEVSDYSDSTYTFVESYFAKKENGKKSSYTDDYLVFVYKEEYQSYFSEEKETRYVYAKCYFDSSFEVDDIYVSPSTLYIDYGTRMDNLDQISDALKHSISKSYKYEKID